ncbi:MAG TPA: hypothetical protein RMG48_08315 [Myxococcales bacterium LLY-WYZ-16_1]|nr:hypothetical protein [Myxococcales bacterium LLY-WYZ-16_1]
MTFDEVGVTRTMRDGGIEYIRWVDLEEVGIVTTGDGPYLTDVFWLLIDRHHRSGCAVPSDAQGMDALLLRLQALPGFDNSTVMEAMGSTDDASFTCWRRTSSGPASSAEGATPAQHVSL